MPAPLEVLDADPLVAFDLLDAFAPTNPLLEFPPSEALEVPEVPDALDELDELDELIPLDALDALDALVLLDVFDALDAFEVLVDPAAPELSLV